MTNPVKCVCTIVLLFVIYFGDPTVCIPLITFLLPSFPQLHIPEETPVADDVDFERLARHDMTGGNIKSSVFRAASRAALRSEDQRKVFMEDLEDAAEEEIGKSTKHTSFRRQDSDTAAMYN